MLDLKKIYDKLPLPKSNNINSFSAITIKGFDNHRIAKDSNDNPSLLIFISEDNQDFFVANQNLFNIQITHNVKCEIEAEEKIIHNNFSVVSYIGQSDSVKDIFLKTCQVLIGSLGQNPTNKKIKKTVDKFIELFKSFKEPPKKSIQGLWCELFLINLSDNPEKLIIGWHSIPEEKFDFSFEKLQIEVKSSMGESRIHHFSSGQLNPIKNTDIIITSVLVSSSPSGMGIIDLIRRIERKLETFPKQKEKLHLLVYSTIGIDIERVNDIKFNYDFSKQSLRFYKSEEIPQIEFNNIPKEVSNVKFTSNLLNSKHLETDIDSILNIYLADVKK